MESSTTEFKGWGATLKTFGDYYLEIILCKAQYAKFEDLFQDITDVFIQLWFQLHQELVCGWYQIPQAATFEIQYVHMAVFLLGMM